MFLNGNWKILQPPSSDSPHYDQWGCTRQLHVPQPPVGRLDTWSMCPTITHVYLGSDYLLVEMKSNILRWPESSPSFCLSSYSDRTDHCFWSRSSHGHKIQSSGMIQDSWLSPVSRTLPNISHWDTSITEDWALTRGQRRSFDRNNLAFWSNSHFSQGILSLFWTFRVCWKKYQSLN